MDDSSSNDDPFLTNMAAHEHKHDNFAVGGGEPDYATSLHFDERPFSPAESNSHANGSFSATPKSPSLSIPAPARIQHEPESAPHASQTGPLPFLSTPRAAPSPIQRCTMHDDAQLISHSSFSSNVALFDSSSSSNGNSRSHTSMPSSRTGHGASHHTQYVNRVRTHSLRRHGHEHTRSRTSDHSDSSFSRGKSPVDFVQSASLPPPLLEDHFSESSSENSARLRRKKRDSSKPRMFMPSGQSTKAVDFLADCPEFENMSVAIRFYKEVVKKQKRRQARLEAKLKQAPQRTRGGNVPNFSMGALLMFLVAIFAVGVIINSPIFADIHNHFSTPTC